MREVTVEYENGGRLEVARFEAKTGPAIQAAVEAVAATVLDAVIKSGAIERTAQRAKEESNE